MRRNRQRSQGRTGIVRVVLIGLAMAMVAAACSGETATTDDDGATTEAPTATEGGTEPEPDTTEAPADPGDTSPATTNPDNPVWADPRGQIFSDFQAGFDRNHPFQSLDEFCLPHEAAASLEDTDAGITATEISLVHLRSKLEDFESIGFGIPVGDPVDMFEVFVNKVNEDCGGVRGRQIKLELIEVEVLGAEVEAQRNAACVEATEDLNAVVIVNTTGFQGTAVLCIVEEHETAFITSQGVNSEWTDRAEGRMASNSPTLEESLQYLSQALIASGELEGKVIGVVMPDVPGQPEAVQSALIEPLEQAGLNVAVKSQIGCGGGTTCADGIPEAVTDMLSAGVDVMFPTLNVVSLPGFISEMVTQGYQPGEVQFYNSDFNSHAGDLVSSKVVSFGGEAAGLLYDGALIIDDANTGGIREPEQVDLPFADMCHATYQAGGGEVFDPLDVSGSGYGMTVGVCSSLRIALRAIYDAGENPTRAEVYDAMQNLGPVDLGDMLPGSLAPGKASMPDVIHKMQFRYPCPIEGFGFGDENTCIVNLEGEEYSLIGS